MLAEDVVATMAERDLSPMKVDFLSRCQDISGDELLTLGLAETCMLLEAVVRSCRVVGEDPSYVGVVEAKSSLLRSLRLLASHGPSARVVAGGLYLTRSWLFTDLAGQLVRLMRFVRFVATGKFSLI